MEFCNFISQAWKVMDFNFRSWKVIESDVHGNKSLKKAFSWGITGKNMEYGTKKQIFTL